MAQRCDKPFDKLSVNCLDVYPLEGVPDHPYGEQKTLLETFEEFKLIITLSKPNLFWCCLNLKNVTTTLAMGAAMWFNVELWSEKFVSQSQTFKLLIYI